MSQKGHKHNQTQFQLCNKFKPKCGSCFLPTKETAYNYNKKPLPNIPTSLPYLKSKLALKTDLSSIIDWFYVTGFLK